MRPPPLPQQTDVLQRVLERIATLHQEPGAPPLVVFDLDGTLYDTRQRTLQILMEYADDVRAEYPDVAACLDAMEVQGVRYLLSTTLKDRGLSHVDVVRDITHWWRERFFSDDYLGYDVPNDGAPEYVSACFESGASVIYLTGRDVPGMLLGTVAALRDHGFPLGVAGVELVLKPDAMLSDEAFKRSALPTLSRVGQVVGFFDNEPANCNLARQICPDADVVLLETQKVPGAPESEEGVRSIIDFRLV